MNLTSGVKTGTMVELAFSVAAMLKASSDGMSVDASRIGCDPISSSGRMRVATSGMLVRTATSQSKILVSEPRDLALGSTRPDDGMSPEGQRADRTSGMLAGWTKAQCHHAWERGVWRVQSRIHGRTLRPAAWLLRVSTNDF